MRYLLLPIIGLLLLSCSTKKIATKIANDFCNCTDSIMNLNIDLTTKKNKLEVCGFYYFQDIEKNSIDNISKKKLEKSVFKRIKSTCPYISKYKDMFNVKRTISDSLSSNSYKCKDFFIDGEYMPIGSDLPIKIIRKGAENIVVNTESKCETIYTVEWISDCEYFLILKADNCMNRTNLLEDSLFVRIIDIKNDTIHYDLDVDSSTFPQLMKRL